MRRLLTGIFIVLFATLTLFGLSFMLHQNGAAHEGCVASGASGTVCPQGIDAFSMIELHFGVLSQFSSVTFSGAPAIDMLALFGSLLFLILYFGSSGISQDVATIIRLRRSFDLLRSTVRHRLNTWLALATRRNPSSFCVFDF